MLQQEISDMSLKCLASLGMHSVVKPAKFKYGSTVKSLLTDDFDKKEITFLGKNDFQIVLPTADYLEAIWNDLYFGNIRINEQCKNLNCLLSTDAQDAWILVTAYYASFFLVNDIAKINGRFVINFDADEFTKLLSTQSSSLQKMIDVEPNSSFIVRVEHSEMSGEIRLVLKKSGARPHQLAWANFSQIANQISVSDERIKLLILLKNICSSGSSNWATPSTVRNLWNYSRVIYFGAKGSEIGRTFKRIIRSESSTFGWAQNNNLKPTEENLAASIAYVFHTLKLSHKNIISRLQIELPT